MQGRAAAADVDVPEGNGTGIVWDTNGHIVTNFHVIGSALKALGDRAAKPATGADAPVVARVTLLGPEGYQTYDGRLIGADRSRDLAVVRINVRPELLRPAAIGTSAALRVGQQVLAIG